MALITHQMQGSYATIPSRPLPWTKMVNMKRFATTLQIVGKIDRSTSLLKHSYCSRAAPHGLVLKAKPLRISAFKGNAQGDESRGRKGGSKLPKNSVKSEETIIESPKVQNVPLSFSSEGDVTLTGSQAIHKLFKRWLTLLHTQSPIQEEEKEEEKEEKKGEILSDKTTPRAVSEIPSRPHKKEAVEILKAFSCYFLSLDPKITAPLFIFVPMFVAVNICYGAKVSKELTPLWVFGPLVVALYVKLFQLLCSLYVNVFKRSVREVKNFPVYYANYVAKGKLKQEFHKYFFQPFANIKNMSYKRGRERLKEWADEMYLDWVESIWPHYCRTIRFLKRANFI